MFRVSLGLVSLFLGVLLLARNFDLLPDPDAATVARRQAVCEALAVECALAAQRKADPKSTEAFVRTVARRNPDVASIGIRGPDGVLVIDTGTHDEFWSGAAADHSTPTHMHAVVSNDSGTKWGSVEVAYQPLHHSGGWQQFLGGSLLPLFAFVGAAALIVTTLFLRTVFRRVDLTQARVVPERVRTTLNTLTEGVLILDRDGVIALANESFAASVGTTVESLRGRKASELPWSTGTVELSADAHPWVQVLHEATPQMGRVLGLKTGAHDKTLSVNATPIFGDDGTCRGALTTFDDLTAVEKARAAAESANKAKDEFLANVSHEIRTPMNAIMGMTELVLEGSHLTAEQRECLGIVGESTTALLDVINDLLDLSKIEAGKFDLDPVDFDLRTTLDDTLQSLALRAHKKGLELACDVDRDVPDVLVGDPTRLRQVVINLVGNAIKFTERGEVLVRVRIEHRRGAQARLHFAVTDTGIGIPADKLRKIFEPFAQADSSTTRRFGGTGLGLTISSHLVELMGGEIWAESTLNRGSTFHFTAALGIPTHSHSCLSLPDMSFIHDLPVLIVEDNPTAGQILVQMLDQVGLRPTLVTSSADALAALEQVASTGHPFPLLVADATLPETDGFALVEEAVRRSLAGAAVLLLSSADVPRDVARSQEAGAAAHLRKPVKRADLVRAIQKVIDPAHVSGHQSRPEPRVMPLTSVGGLNILVAEDNVFNQKVSAMKLERWGHRVRIVASGREALEALDAEPFDLIFADIQMPDMDGYELTAAIRAWEADHDRKLPIVAMTAHAMKGVRERCLAAGMDDYVSKPIRDEELLAAIQRVCPSQLDLAQDTFGHRLQDTAQILPHLPAALDEDELLARVGGNRDVLRGLIVVFYQDCNNLMAGLKQSIRDRDEDAVRTAAHTVKGMIAFFAAKKAVAAATKLEQAAGRGDFAEATRHFSMLAQELAGMEDWLASYSPAPDGWHRGMADGAAIDTFSFAV